jgi:hypothetical protein
MRFRYSLAALCLYLFSNWAGAQSIPLTNLTQDDYKGLVGDFTADTVHTSVSGAGTLGHLFGFEIGLVGGVTNTPKINELVKKAGTDSDVPRLPHGELLGIVTVPFGISVEAGFIPKVGGADFKFSSYNLAAKWTFTELLTDLPLSMAVKAQTGKANLNFDATIQSTPTHFDFTNTTTALEFLVSKDLGILEPYLMLGTVSGNGKMNVTGSSQVFQDPDMQAAMSASAKRSSGMWALGTELKLVIFKAGLEYSRLFGTNSFTGKLSFYF